MDFNPAIGSFLHGVQLPMGMVSEASLRPTSVSQQSREDHESAIG